MKLLARAPRRNPPRRAGQASIQASPAAVGAALLSASDLRAPFFRAAQKSWSKPREKPPETAAPEFEGNGASARGATKVLVA